MTSTWSRYVFCGFVIFFMYFLFLHLIEIKKKDVVIIHVKLLQYRFTFESEHSKIYAKTLTLPDNDETSVDLQQRYLTTIDEIVDGMIVCLNEGV